MIDRLQHGLRVADFFALIDDRLQYNWSLAHDMGWQKNNEKKLFSCRFEVLPEAVQEHFTVFLQRHVTEGVFLFLGDDGQGQKMKVKREKL